MNILKFFCDLLDKDIEGQYEDKAFAIVIRSVLGLAVLYYLFMGIVLIMNSQIDTGLGSLFGVLVYVSALYLTHRVSVNYAFWVYVVTEVLMTFSGVLYFGWHMGFQYTILLLMMLTAFNLYLEFWKKLVVDIILVLSFLGMYFYTYYRMPWIVMHNSTDIIVTIVSNIHIIGSFCIAGFYFSSKNLEMSKNLMAYSKTLEKSAFFDTLTGLYNRGEALKFLEKNVKSIDDKGDTLSVVICDIDLFKRVNDSYGHEGGDVVLKEISKLLQEFMGDRGVVSRWGGEEFLLIFPNVDCETATAYANEILEQIRETYINYNGYVVQVTMSFGVQQYIKNKTVDDMISRADKKLYKAKNSGRNKVIS